MAIGQHVHSSSHKATAIAPQLSLLDLSYSRVADAEQLLPLLQLPRLGVLMVIGTLLAQQCQAGIIALQVKQVLWYIDWLVTLHNGAAHVPLTDHWLTLNAGETNGWCCFITVV